MQHARMVVRTFVLDDEDRLLLVKHKKKRPDGELIYWVPPGGDAEAGETTPEAACREVLEETGWHVRIDALLWTVEEKRGDALVICNYFLATRTGGELVLGADPEVPKDDQVLCDIGLFTKEQTQKMTIFPRAAKEDFWLVFEQGVGRRDVWRERPSHSFNKY